jgi:hypothetical protein
MVFLVGTCNYWFLAGNVALITKSIQYQYRERTQVLIFYVPKTVLLLHISKKVFEKMCGMHLNMFFVFFCLTHIETCWCDKEFEF